MKARTGLRAPTRAIPPECTAGYTDEIAAKLTRELLQAYNRAATHAEKIFDAQQVAVAFVRGVLQDASIIVRAESSERAAARLAAMGAPT